MPTQTDFFAPDAPPCDLPNGVQAADLADFRAALISAGTWQTRADLAARLGWDERKIRAVAQALGGSVVRCQAGYKLTAACTRDDLGLMTQAANAAGSQGRLQIAYEVAMLRAIHAMVG